MLDLVGIAMRPPIEVTPFFNLVMVWNHGISFGMFSDPEHDYTPFILIAVAFIISAILLRWMWKSVRLKEALAIGLVIGGAMGNVIDRVLYGYVLDFLNMSCCGFRNPYSFNIADIFIFAGAIGLVFFAPDDKKAS